MKITEKLRAVGGSRATSVVLGAALAVTLGGGTAVAAATIGTDDIRNGAVTKQKIHKDAVGGWEALDRSLTGADVKQDSLGRWVFTPYLRGLIEDVEDGSLQGEQGPQGEKGEKGDPGLSELESDGPYPGATQLQDGDNSSEKWVGDEGASLQSSWVMCPEDKTAIGGGYSRADEGPAAFKGLQIVTSQPVQVVDGNPQAYTPIEGDVDGSYVPNGWLVEGFNNNDSGELIVRPHVVCAVVNH